MTAPLDIAKKQSKLSSFHANNSDVDHLDVTGQLKWDVVYNFAAKQIHSMTRCAKRRLTSPSIRNSHPSILKCLMFIHPSIHGNIQPSIHDHPKAHWPQGRRRRPLPRGLNPNTAGPLAQQLPIALLPKGDARSASDRQSRTPSGSKRDPKWQHIGLVWDWLALAWAGRTHTNCAVDASNPL